MSTAGTVAFVGLRCAGKSSLARSWSALHALPVFDLDDLLAREGPAEYATAGALLSARGEEEFRACESRALARFLEERCEAVVRVLATGGGAVVRPENRALLREHCLVIWLDAPAALLAARLHADDAERPSLTGLEPAAELALQAGEREPLYREVADLRLDASQSPPALLGALERCLRKQPGGRFVLREDGSD